MRLFLTLMVVLFASILQVKAQTSPNIVLIMTDDQEFRSMAYMPKTKALLADKGITFTNSFVHFSQCCPSRASWLSGQYTHNNGVLGNSPLYDGGYGAWKPTEGNSLPVWLQNAGYTTGLAGKYLNNYDLETNHVPPGWSWWRGYKSPPNYYNWTIYAPNYPGGFFTAGSTPGSYSTDDLKSRALNFVTVQPHPHFLWVSLWAPHTTGSAPIPSVTYANTMNVPLIKTPAFNSDHMTGKHPRIAAYPVRDANGIASVQTYWNRYLETLQSVDDLVEAVVNKLTELGTIDNTYIIFTSDNGYMMGEYKWMGKVLPYERSIRVPLIIRGPGIPEGQTRPQLVSNVDVSATIVDLASANPLRVLDGRSLRPLFSGTPYAWRTALPLAGLYDPQLQYGTEKTRWRGVRTTTMKYIIASDGFEELYDLRADPYERFSVVNDPYYANALTDLRAKEVLLRNCIGNNCWIQ